MNLMENPTESPNEKISQKSTHPQLTVLIPHYREGSIRFLQLALLIVVVLGNMYAFNNPQALQQHFIEDLSINQFEFNMLYTVDALPNIFLSIVIGFWIDYFGVRICIILICVFSTLSQLIVAIGGFTDSYATIIAGRILFGVGLQSAITAQAFMISSWFRGAQLALALGIGITFPELGNALNSITTPLIYDSSHSLGAPLLVSVGVCLISTVCSILAVLLDIRAEKADSQNLIVFQDTQTQDTPGSINPDKSESQSGPKKNHPKKSNYQNLQQQTEEIQTIKISDLKHFKGTYWLIITLCMLGISQYVPFMDNVNSLFVKRFCLTQVEAGRFILITYMVGALFTVPLGMVVDRIGYRRYFIITGMGVFLVAQAIIFIQPTCTGSMQVGPVIALFFIGIGYCFYANCTVAVIPLIVKKKMLGTAFGIMGMAQSISETFVPLISGAIISSQDGSATGYRLSSLFFTCIGLLGFIISLGLFCINQHTKHKLDRQSRRRKVVKITKQMQIQIVYPKTYLKRLNSGQITQREQQTVQIQENTKSLKKEKSLEEIKEPLIPASQKFAYDQNSD